MFNELVNCMSKTYIFLCPYDEKKQFRYNHLTWLLVAFLLSHDVD